MRKTTAILLSIFTIGFISWQLVAQEQKQTKKDTVKLSTTTINEAVVDSFIVYKGKFKPYKQSAHASYYHDKFTGKRTASGKIFNNNKLTAAHKKLPFGSIVKVTNQTNGKSIVVEITDRGPFVKGREIDLSKKAFMTIAHNKSSGQMTVTLEVLQK